MNGLRCRGLFNNVIEELMREFLRTLEEKKKKAATTQEAFENTEERRVH